MAAFDASTPAPQEAPNYLRYSRSISDIPPNKSGEILFKGIGDAIEEGVKGLDETLKKHAEYLGQQLGDQEQTDFLNGVKVADSLTRQQDNAPQAIKDGLDFIQRNEDAKSQGRIRETEYYRNLYEKAKQLRSQWPGYRDYIDKGVEKATGITPNANKYIQSLLSDINERLTKQDKITNEVVSQAVRQAGEGAPGMADNVIAYQNGKLSAQDLLKYSNRANALKWNSQQDVDRMHSVEAGDKIGQSAAEKVINGTVPMAYSHMLDGLTVNIGPKNYNVQELMDSVAKGEKPDIPDEAFQQLAQFENQRYLRLRAQQEAEFNKPGPNGQPSVRVMAGSSYKKTMDDAYEQHKQFQEAMTNKDIGAMFRTKNAAEAQLNGGVYTALQGSLRPTLLALNAFNKAGGSNLTPLIYSELNKQGVGKIDQNSIGSLIANLATNTKLKGIDSLSKSVDTVVYGSRDSTGQPNPAAVNAMIKIPAQMLTSPELTDDAKMNIIRSTFSPSNYNLFSKIEMDYTTPDGRKISGRYGAFSYFTSPETAKEIKRLSGIYGSNVYENYKNWSEVAFTNDLFARSLKTLAETEKAPNYEIHWKVPEGGGPPQFVGQQLYRSSNRGTARVTDLQNPWVQHNLDNINEGIRSMYNVYKQDREEGAIPARLLQIMHSSGISADEGNSLARGLLIAIGAKQKLEDAMKSQQRAPDASGN
jgi:hypothetical protein